MAKALFINGSPRKNFNTAQLLHRAMEGAKEAGAEVEIRSFMERLIFPVGTYFYENGKPETLYVCNTYQFNDYSRYDFNLFSEEDKRKYRDEHFDIDLNNAYELGKRLVTKCDL